MSDAAQPVADRTNSTEMESFYLALSALNVNLIARVIQKPEAVGAITEEIRGYFAHHQDTLCPPGKTDYHDGRGCVLIEEVYG